MADPFTIALLVTSVVGALTAPKPQKPQQSAEDKYFAARVKGASNLLKRKKMITAIASSVSGRPESEFTGGTKFEEAWSKYTKDTFDNAGATTGYTGAVNELKSAGVYDRLSSGDSYGYNEKDKTYTVSSGKDEVTYPTSSRPAKSDEQVTYESSQTPDGKWNVVTPYRINPDTNKSEAGEQEIRSASGWQWNVDDDSWERMLNPSGAK